MDTLQADADGDGDVDGADFLMIQRTNTSLIPQWELEYGATSGSLAAAQGVPEPTTACLLALSALLAAYGRPNARRP